jgi:adenine-specific DNA methylase
MHNIIAHLLFILKDCTIYRVSKKKSGFYCALSRVFKNRVLRKVFGPKWDEVTGQWRRLRNEELMIRTNHRMLFG